MHADGFVEAIIDMEDEILECHIMGSHASTVPIFSSVQQ
jgi:pyruvate/2-oxoglutarate dehydrogenase complex dihydrolipoamide dehydrogenase (E3) component